MGIIAKPLGLLLTGIYNMVNNYGIALIIFTIVVRVCMIPLYTKQLKTSAEMSSMQPKIQEIQQRYAKNPELMQQPSLLSFRKEDGEIDHDKANLLKEVFTVEEYSLNPNVKKKTTLEEYYEDLVSQVANSGYVYQGIYENQQTAVSEAFSAREQVVGVSSDEELTNMIMYQNAYNAASRYINVVDEMIEHIISTLAM